MLKKVHTLKPFQQVNQETEIKTHIESHMINSLPRQNYKPR